MSLIDEVCEELAATDMPKPVTLVSLSASPGAYVPILSHILQQYEKYHRDSQGHHDDLETQDSDEKDGLHQDYVYQPRLFSLCPVPSLYINQCKCSIGFC